MERKCIFLGYATEVKGYRLWCTYQETPGLIISRNVTFNESALLDSQKKKTIAKTNHGISDHIEVEIESPLAQLSSSELEVVQNINQGDNVDATYITTITQYYNRQKEQNDQPINRFANVVNENFLRYANCAEFSLSVAKTIDLLESNRYKGATFILEADRWIGAIGEEIELLYKNRTQKFGSLPIRQKLVGCKKDIDVKKVSTHDNTKDMMTNTVLSNKFRHCPDLIGVCSTQ